MTDISLKNLMQIKIN